MVLYTLIKSPNIQKEYRFHKQFNVHFCLIQAGGMQYMKDKIANIQVSLPMIFLVAQLLNSWSIITLIITATLVVGMYLWEKGDSRAKKLLVVGLSAELLSSIMGIPNFLKYGVNHYYGMSLYFPHLAALTAYTLLVLVFLLKVLKGNQCPANKVLMNVLYGVFVGGIFLDIAIHYGTDREALSLGGIIWLVFKLMTLCLIEQVHLRKLVSSYSLARAAAYVLIVLLVLSILGGAGGFAGGGSPSVNRCRSCGRSFQAGAGSNFMSIARSGMCSNCYNNFKWGQQFIGK